jgi:hypothetical protein
MDYAKHQKLLELLYPTMASAGSLGSVSCLFCSCNSVSLWGWLCCLVLYTGRALGSHDLGSLGYFLGF